MKRDDVYKYNGLKSPLWSGLHSPLFSPFDGSSLATGVAAAWSPLSLFAAGEKGVWYDPSDFSTMFQDHTGTTPVTAVGQTVGLVLDKRLGATPLADSFAGPGSFSSATGWSIGAGYAITGGQLVATAAGSGVTTSYNGAVTSGKWYKVTVTVAAVTAGSVRIECGGSAGPTYTAAGTYTFHARAINAFCIVQSMAAGSSFAIESIALQELPGNHATQATPASRPLLQESGGKYYLSFDGSDDFLVTGNIDFTATDKMTVVVGVRRLTDTAGVIAELSADWNANAGSFLFFGGSDTNGLGNGFSSSSRGAAAADVNQFGYTPTTFTPPVTAVVSASHDIAGDLTSVRGNGTAGTNGTGDKGTGNFGNHALYIGRRGGATLAFYGRIYQLIVRGAATADPTAVEAYVAGKTGVTL